MSITGYWQYLLAAEMGNSKEAEAIYGAKPFGPGLKVWIERSPEFHMDRVSAPLMVVGEGAGSVFTMWEPYAALRQLGKPTELVMLNTTEHVLSNPAVRTASQGGSVDWFRFWLQGYEDPNPAKSEQYQRWRELRGQANRQAAVAPPQAAAGG